MNPLSAGPAQPPLTAPVKPRLRGVSHQYAFFAALVLGVLVVLLAPGGEARFAGGVYAAAVAGLFGCSALYHRRTWTPPVRRWMRRLDHSMIFVLIAGTYTPFGLLALDGTLAVVVLAIVWGGALAGVVLKLVWIDAPNWLAALVYVALGWVAVAALPQLHAALGLAPLILLIVGGTLYTAGGIIYATQKPNPSPTVFGYHEVFHVLVILAALVHYVAVAFFVLPRAG